MTEVWLTQEAHDRLKSELDALAPTALLEQLGVAGEFGMQAARQMHIGDGVQDQIAGGREGGAGTDIVADRHRGKGPLVIDHERGRPPLHSRRPRGCSSVGRAQQSHC